MVVYHLSWDLDDFAIATFDLYGNALWIGFRSLILIMFLGIMGMGLVLAARGGLDTRRYWRRYLRRLALIVVSAAAVTVGSLYLLPESPIYFGVLQFIAAASVLALPALRWRWYVLAGAAALVWAVSFFPYETFDAPWLQWVGLMTFEPVSSDYVPLLPWMGAVLAGMALARLAFGGAGESVGQSTMGRALAGWRAGNPAARALVAAGRRSLIVYLLHQPVLIGALSLAIVAAPQLTEYSADFDRGFLRDCQAKCERGNMQRAFCAGWCQCGLAALHKSVPWRDARHGAVPEEARPEIDARTRQCLVGK